MQNKNKRRDSRRWSWTPGIVVGGLFLLLALVVWWLGCRLFAPAASPNNAEDIEEDAAAVEGSMVSFFKKDSDYPVMIMIDNLPEARPYQSGLAEARVIYETLAESGSTRLAALFAGAPAAKKIGPVRSARPYFVELALGWGAFFWHAGGSPEALALIKKSSLINLNEISGLGPIYFWRDQGLPAPRNLFTAGERIKKALEDFKLSKLPSEKITWRWEQSAKSTRRQWEKSATTTASQIKIDFSPGEIFDAEYVFNTQKKLYERRHGSRPVKDSASGATLAAANVIVQRVPAEKLLPSGYDRIGINLVGEGEALFFRDGRVAFGRWRKRDRASQTEWLDAKGKPLKLKYGQTWVEIVPGDRLVFYQ